MKIRGNTVGPTMPRADYGETDPRSASYIKNKPDEAIQKAQTTADEAKTAAGDAQTAAYNAQTAADNAQTAADNAQATANAALPMGGGTMEGALHVLEHLSLFIHIPFISSMGILGRFKNMSRSIYLLTRKRLLMRMTRSPVLVHIWKSRYIIVLTHF